MKIILEQKENGRRENLNHLADDLFFKSSSYVISMYLLTGDSWRGDETRVIVDIISSDSKDYYDKN